MSIRASFARLTPDASRWYAMTPGHLIVRDDWDPSKRPVGIGRQPIPQANGDILAAGNILGVSRFMPGPDGAWTRLELAEGAPANVFTATASGAWAYYTAEGGRPRIVCWDGLTFEGHAAVALSPEAQTRCLQRHDNGNLITVWYNEAGEHRTLLDDRGCSLRRWTEGGLTWTVERPQAQAWGAPGDNLSLWPQEWAIAIVLGPRGERWTLTGADESLLLRRIGERTGYRLPPLLEPDIVWHQDSQRFRIVGQGNGILDLWVDPADPRVWIAPPVVVPVPPAPPMPPSPPTVPPSPSPDLQAPGVTVLSFATTLGADRASVIEFVDRGDPRHGTTRVELVPTGPHAWSWHVGIRRPEGEDRSGRLREMRLVGQSPPPVPPPVDPPPDPPSGPGTEPIPPVGDASDVRANFLSFAWDEPQPTRRQWVFGYLSSAFDGRRETFLRAYPAAGHVDIPVSVYGQYPGDGSVFPWYDYRNDLDGLSRHYDTIHRAGARVMLFLATDDRQPHTWDSLRRDADRLVPHALSHGLRFFVDAWEGDQVAGYLSDHGQHALDYIAHVRGLLPSDAILAHHPGGHRTDDQEMLYAGWFEDREWDRYDWCRKARAAGLNAMLANFSPRCREEQLLMLFHDEPQKHGAGPGALGMWQWAGLDGYLFEHTQLDVARWRRLTTRAMQDPRCKGRG